MSAHGARLFGPLKRAIRRRLRAFLPGAAIVAIAAVFGAISLGFGALAAYIQLGAVEGGRMPLRLLAT